MALRQSTALRNFKLEGGSLKDALNNCEIRVYTGTQPANADAAATGTLLTKYTLSSGTRTAEVLATGGLTIAGASGAISTFTVNSLEIMGSSTAFNTTLTQTAVDICYKINNNPKNKLFKATSVVDVITLTAKPGLGSLANGWVVTGTGATMTVGTLVNMGSGVSGVTAVNGLTWGDSAAGILAKNTSETWSGVSVDTGTAGWFRIVGSVADAGALDSSEVYIRLDGNIATSGANMNLSSTTHTATATQTLGPTFMITDPAS